MGRLTAVLAAEAEVSSLAEVGITIQKLLANGLACGGVGHLLEPF